MEVWEQTFQKSQAMWGLNPSKSTLLAAEFLKDKNINCILIVGFGYGRNAKVFLEQGIDVTGIEISKTAIDIARQNKIDCTIYHGDVLKMPFDTKIYDSVYSYALIHLLDQDGRTKLINDCYNQLKPGGYMIFVTIAPKSIDPVKTTKITETCYKVNDQINLFYYDKDSIQNDFGKYGLVDIVEVSELGHNDHRLYFNMIICKKEN